MLNEGQLQGVGRSEHHAPLALGPHNEREYGKAVFLFDGPVHFVVNAFFKTEARVQSGVAGYRAGDKQKLQVWVIRVVAELGVDEADGFDAAGHCEWSFMVFHELDYYFGVVQEAIIYQGHLKIYYINSS